jgi:hypothetical protein
MVKRDTFTRSWRLKDRRTLDRLTAPVCPGARRNSTEEATSPIVLPY